jgi:hydroxymethylbilane synthase
LLLSKGGVDILGLQDRITTVFEPDLLMPCAQQGTIGAQCRANDAETIALLEGINHAETMICIEAERAMLRKLEGNCFSPIAGYCEVTKGGNLRMLAMVASVDGSQVIRSRVKLEGQEPIALGTAVAQDLLDQGAAALIQEAARLKAC